MCFDSATKPLRLRFYGTRWTQQSVVGICFFLSLAKEKEERDEKYGHIQKAHDP